MHILRVHIDKLHLRHMPFQTVADLSRGFAGGVNFGYFYRSPSHPQGSSPEGAVIADGEVMDSRVVPGRPALVHTSRLRIQDVWGINQDWASSYRVLAQAGPWLVRDGQAVTEYAGYPGIDPHSVRRRVAVGVDVDQVYIAVGDGTLADMARALREVGCSDAIAGDGGSSVSLVQGGELVFGGGQLVPNALVWEDAEKIHLCPPGVSDLISRLDHVLKELEAIREELRGL